MRYHYIIVSYPESGDGASNVKIPSNPSRPTLLATSFTSCSFMTPSSMALSPMALSSMAISSTTLSTTAPSSTELATGILSCSLEVPRLDSMRLINMLCSPIISSRLSVYTLYGGGALFLGSFAPDGTCVQKFDKYAITCVKY